MTEECVSLTVIGNLAYVTIRRPPVNSLNHATRQQLVAAFLRCNMNSQVSAVVLAGEGGTFCAGADVNELEDAESFFRSPRIVDVAQCIEDCSKPVVVAMEGNCLGGGLEIALAAHYRIADSRAMLGLPEVRLGVIPAAGGTQRLPKLVGVGRALRMMLDGAPVAACELTGTALLDQVVEGQAIAAAEAFALSLPSHVKPPRTSTLAAAVDSDGSLEAAECYLAQDRQKGLIPARRKIIEAIGIGLTSSYAIGAEFEQQAARELLGSVESLALRHVFSAERASRKPAVLGIAAREVSSVGLIGAGTMGAGIAMSFLDNGFDVIVLESTNEALRKGLGRIQQRYEKARASGKLDASQVSQRMLALRGSLDYQDLSEVDLVVEAVFEDMAVKRSVFERLDGICKDGAILATNTSYLDVNMIAAFTQRPQDVVGLHFFSPANTMRLIEIVRGAKTDPAVIATAQKVAARLQKTSVVAGVCDGFIGNRMFVRYVAAAHCLVMEGASPGQVDGCLERFGMAMGPFRVGDLAGLDISHAGRKRRAQEANQPFVPGLGDQLVEAGRFGQKTGAGWYRYAPGCRDPLPDFMVDALVDKARAEAGVATREISDDEILQRCIFALVNEGARILEEGIAQSARDIDLVYINGYGFPRERGGPMFYANTVGLARVETALREFAEGDADRSRSSWQPAALLTSLSRSGKPFS